jgi:hypothetical protein
VPTLYKPILNEPESIWSTPAKTISDQVFDNRVKILEALNFYEEHGRVGEVGGKFDEQIHGAENELLAELAGVLTFAAASAAAPRTGEAIATLEWIKKHPSSAKDYTLPGFAEWLLIRHYQRDEERKGTYFPDIMGFVPNGFRDTIQVPEEKSIFAAASAAIEELDQGRSPGRPSSGVTRVLAEGLRAIFLRYNVKITRRFETSWRDGEFVEVEAGAFLDFVRAAVVPLQNFLRGRKVAPQSIVRLAATQFLP